MTAEALAAIPAKYAQPDPSTLAKLPKSTKKENPKGHCDVCNGFHGLPAIHLDYMGHADITLALIDVDPCWTWEPMSFDDDGPKISAQGGRLVMWAYLTVLGKRMLGVGTCEIGKGDPEKELIGDFLRNAAMRFGIATKLWSKADTADPAGSGATGGYERPQRGQAVKPTRAREVFALVTQLPDEARSDLKAWAAGKSMALKALDDDPSWLAEVEAKITELQAAA